MLNLDSRSRSKLAWIATLLTPVVAVQGVRLATGMSTSSASAATAPAAADAAPTPITGEAEKPLTPAQAEAVKWLLARSATLPRRSPMDRPDQAPPPTPQPEVHMERPHAPEPMKTTDEAPVGLTLTSMIAGSPDGPALCAINHHIYRVGQEVAPSWRISRIDARHRVVVLAGPEGRTAALTPPTPDPDR